MSGQSKETALAIYLAFLAKVANLYNIILTAFNKYWPDTVAKFISGTQDGEHITHLHTCDIVTFETDITDT